MSKLTIVAGATLFLSIFILSFPAGNGMEGTTERPAIEDARIMLEWGYNDNIQSTAGFVLSGSTMSGTTIWDGTVSISNGTLQVIRPLAQNEGDGIVNEEGQEIQFLSKISSGVDGIYLRVIPYDTTPVLTFKTQTGTELTLNLNYLISQRTATAMLSGGRSVRIQREAITLNKGSLQLQFDKVVAEKVRICMESKTEEVCRTEVMKELRSTQTALLRKKVSQLWQDRNMVRSSTGNIMAAHPDFLLFLSNEELYSMESSVFKKIQLRDLSDIHKSLYNKILSTAPEKFASLSLTLQEKSMILEGATPEDIRLKAGLTEGEFQVWKQVILSLPEEQRTEVIGQLRLLPSELLTTIKGLEQGQIRKVFGRLLLLPAADIESNIMLYTDQLLRLETLNKRFGQLHHLFTNAEVIALEKAFVELETSFIYKTNNSPLQNIDDLLTSAAVLSATELRDRVSSTLTMIGESIMQSRVERYKAGLTTFTDVEDGAWSGFYIHRAKELGAVDGYKTSDQVLTGEFGPNNGVLVGELLKIALELSDNGTSDSEPTLLSAQNHWAKGYVARAEEMQISLTKDTSLDLNRRATRAEVVQTLLESFSISPELITTSSFTDLSPFASYARYVEFARGLGIVSGDDGKNTFRPLDPVNRAETAKIATTIVYYIKSPLELSNVSGDLGL